MLHQVSVPNSLKLVAAWLQKSVKLIRLNIKKTEGLGPPSSHSKSNYIQCWRAYGTIFLYHYGFPLLFPAYAYTFIFFL